MRVCPRSSLSVPALLALLVALPACNNSGSSSCEKDALSAYGVRVGSYGKGDITYQQYKDDPISGLTVGSFKVSDKLDKGPDTSIYFRFQNALSRFQLDQKSTINTVQGVDENGVAADYFELQPGAKNLWWLTKLPGFDAQFGAYDKLSLDFHKIVPLTQDAWNSSLLGTRDVKIKTTEPLFAPGLSEMDTVLGHINPNYAILRPMYTWAATRGVPVYHSDGVQMRLSHGEGEINFYSGFMADFSQTEIDNINNNFPNGVGPYGITARAQPSLGLTAGYYWIAGRTTEKALDTAQFGISYSFQLAQTTEPPPNIYQLGLVVDRNHNEADNYRASAAYPKDLYDDSDRWLNGAFDQTGLSLQFIDATQGLAGNNPTVVPSTALMIVSGHAILYIVKADEVTDSTATPPEPPPFRHTFFRHTGDFGAQGDFDVDTEPFVGEPLAEY
jgi:hypothetical protein